MPRPFYERLRNYYLQVAQVLKGEAAASSVFPNSTDVGMSRERIYIEFLKQHAPSKCNVFQGGYLFDRMGAESMQMDIIVTTDTAPNFNFHNPNGTGKSFSPVEGTIAVASIKSKLTKQELENALEGIASIPPTESLEKRLSPFFKVNHYDDWPYKIIYASDGISDEKTLDHVNNYYKKNHEIPLGRRPNIIHVSDKFLISKADTSAYRVHSKTGERQELEYGSYNAYTHEADLQAIAWILYKLQILAYASSNIMYSYEYILGHVTAQEKWR